MIDLLLQINSRQDTSVKRKYPAGCDDFILLFCGS